MSKLPTINAKPGFFKSPEMAKKFPLRPKHPERTCWGCDKYCSVDALQCGNGSGRTQHPAEMLGDDWYLWGDWGITVEDEQELSADNADVVLSLKTDDPSSET